MGRPPQDENRKDHLIEIALKILGSQGFAALSFQKVADQALVSQSTVMYYFPNKNALLAEISTYVAIKNRSYVEAHDKITDNAEDKLRKFLVLNFQWAEKNPEYAQNIILLSYLAMTNSEFKDSYNLRLKSVREKIMGILYAGLREGVFHFKESEAPELAALFHNFLVSAITNSLASRLVNERKSYTAKVDILIRDLTKRK